MAVLNKIRQRSVFLIAIIALALFAFVLADVLKGGGMSPQKDRTLATINDEDITQEEFARKVEIQTARYGGGITTTQAVNAVWEQEVRRVLLEEQFDELGITVEQDRVNDILKQALQDDPNFQNEDGIFSEQKMREYVATLKATNPQMYDQWVAYENQLAKNEQQNIYFNLVRAGLNVTQKEGQIAYEMENNLRDIEFVQIPYSSIADDQVEVTKDDVAAYIKERKDQFQTEATRSLRYVKFDEKASLADEKVIEESVAELLKKRTAYTASTKTTDTIKGFAEVINAEEFVNEYSDLRFADRYFFESEIPAGVRDSLWKLNEGEVYGPYRDGGYFKISKVISVAQLPDSVKASHILVTYAGLPNAAGQTRTKAEAKKLADSLAGVIKSTPAKMAELAPVFSADGSRDRGGDLGYATRNTYVKPFNDYIFEGQVGEVGVVDSQFGYHVTRIDDQKNRQRALKMATVAKEIKASQETINEIFNVTTKFQMAAGKQKKEFAEIAKDSGYLVRPVNSIRIFDENIPGQGGQRDIIRWAFDEDRETGDIERFNVEGGYLVVQLTEKTKEGLMSVDNASATVTPIIRNQKKAKLIMDKIKASDLKTVANNNNVEVQTASGLNLRNPTIAGAGTEPKVVGAAFGLKEAEVSKPLEGDKGVYMVKVTAIKPATQLDSYANFALQMTAAERASVDARVMQALKEAAEIDDRRATFY